MSCHMSQLHVPCHFDRVSDFLNFARLIVPKVIVLSIVKIAEAIARNCQKLKFKKCQNCGDVMFLITLIKCLKGHKSLGSLCCVVKTLIVSGNSARDGPRDKVTY